MTQQRLVLGDTALEAFERLRVRQVKDADEDTASTFLAKFQTTAASLGPNERIKLEVAEVHDTIALLKAVLADLQASKICALYWQCDGEGDVDSVIPLLTSNCPELSSLRVNFNNHSEFDFVSSMLEHPGNHVKALELEPYKGRNFPRFFAALEQSQVSALTLFSTGFPDFVGSLCGYLVKDLLVRLKVIFNDQVPSEMMMSLVHCTCLATLEMFRCQFVQRTVFAKSITKLVLNDCMFVGGVDWSFLADSNVQELDFYDVSGVDGNHLGGALAVRLRARGLDKLHFRGCGFVDETLAAVGVEIGRIKRLDFDNYLNDNSVELIALALQSPNSEMKELKLPYYQHTRSSISTYLVPALRHSNCRLDKLRLWASQAGHQAAANTIEARFHKRITLFVLLQGQQVRRKVPCPLRRLPVEMFRMVGEVLL